MGPPATSRRASRDAWVVGLVSAVVGLTALGFGRFAYALLLPLMQDSLGLSYSQAGWISGANLFGFLSGALLGGSLAATLGARPVVGTALLIGAAGAGLTAASAGASAVAGCQFLVGLGAGGAMVPAQNVPIAWFPLERRGLASGLPSAGIGAGLVAAGMGFPLLLSLEIGGLTGWRLAWVAIAVAFLAGSALSFWLLRESPGAARQRGPLRPAFQARRLARLCVVYFLFGFSYLSYVAFFGAVVAGQRHWKPGAIGAAWALGGLLSIASGLLWGGVSDRLGRPRAMGLVFGVQAFAYLTMALLPWDFAVYASVVLWGTTAWAIPGLAATVATEHVGVRMVHPAMALVNVVGSVGQISGPVVSGYAVDLTQSFVPGLLLIAAVALLGGALARSLRATAAGLEPAP